jgi:hypothetical protein
MRRISDLQYITTSNTRFYVRFECLIDICYAILQVYATSTISYLHHVQLSQVHNITHPPNYNLLYYYNDYYNKQLLLLLWVVVGGGVAICNCHQNLQWECNGEAIVMRKHCDLK